MRANICRTYRTQALTNVVYIGVEYVVCGGLGGMEALEGGDSMQISPAYPCHFYPFHFVGVMMMVRSHPVVVIWAWGFWETVDGVLVEWAQLLDGVGWVVGVPVLAAAEAADGHCWMVFWWCFFCAKLSKRRPQKLNAFLVAKFSHWASITNPYRWKAGNISIIIPSRFDLNLNIQ